MAVILKGISMRKQIYLNSLIFPAVILLFLGMAQANDIRETALFKAAQANQRSQKWKESLDKFQQVIALNPDTPLAHKARIEIGKYHKYHRDWDKAISLYREVVSRAPHSRQAHDALTAEAAIHYFRQDFPAALSIFKEVYGDTQDWDQVKYCSYWIKEILRKSSFDHEQQFSCGKESVKIAFNILGMQLNETELNSLFTDKSTMLSLCELNNAVSRKGLKSKVVKVTAADIQNLDTPFIALVKPEHYVVVTKTQGSNVTFVETAGIQESKTQDLGGFLSDFRGYALVFLKDSRLAKAGISVPDEDLKNIKGGVCLCCPPADLGVNPNTEYDGAGTCKVGMPGWLVNTASLNFIVQDIDLAYSSRGMPVTFVRTYNSDDPREGVFGRSWTFNYNVTLVENPDKSIDIRRGDGKVEHFFWNGTRYQSPWSVFDSLVKNADGSYTLTIKTDKSVYNFNAQGVLINIKDRNNNTISFTYDTESKLTVITDPNGKNITLTYGSNNKVSRVTLPDARFISFVYDANNNLIQSTDMVGATSSFRYDSTSYITEIVTPLRGVTTIAYSNSEGKAVSVITDAQENQRNYGRYQNSSQVRIIDSRGNATIYKNNYYMFTESITSASGNKVSFEYDYLGNRSKVKDSLGNAVTITYDGKGNPLTVTDPLTNKAAFTYDANNNLISAADPKGNISSFTYGANNNLISAKDADNQVTSFEYNCARPNSHRNFSQIKHVWKLTQ